jgi:hypothetical protein
MRRATQWALCLVTLVGPAGLQAQTDSVRPPSVPVAASPANGPPVRRIATASAVSTEQLGSINSVRELPDGRVLVNDGSRRRLLLMDTTLKTVKVVLDSLSEMSNTYGVQPGSLIPWRADSTIFIDRNALAMLIIDPAGEIARVRSVPSVNQLGLITGNSGYGLPSVDAKGRLIYTMWVEPPRPARPPPRGVPWFPEQPDSQLVVGIDFDTRRIDTLGAIRIPKYGFQVRMNPNGGFNVIDQTNPLPSQDEYAVLSDGSVAFVRSIDYRIDYLNPDGSWSSSPKLPYDWQPVPDSLKRAIVDSVHKAQSRNAHVSYTNALIRWVNMYGKGYPENFKAPENFVPQQGFAKHWKFPPGVTFPANYTYACAPNEEPTMLAPNRDTSAAAPVAGTRGGMEAEVARRMESMGISPAMPGGPAGGRPSCIPMPIANTNAPAPPTMRDVAVVPYTMLPDYKPSLAQGGAVRADADGNVWIRPVQPRPIPGGPVYDIVSRSGEMIDRLQLPQGYNIVGFGKGKIVYLSMRDRTGLHLARVRLR